MTEQVEIGANNEPKRIKKKTRLLAGSAALGGMIVGALVGIGVQQGVESTGLLGPGIDELVQEQASNFVQVNERLDALANSADDPEIRNGLAEIGTLLARQDELNNRSITELRYLGGQVATMKEQQLATTGTAGGADFWLKVSESVNIGTRSQVLSLLGANGNIAQVNLSGRRKRMIVGDTLHVASDGASCTVFYKQATKREDRRVGFDVICE